ncbi:MAG: glycosyl hydrolase family 28-related protein [Verrucomicrobiota bacterium]
MSTMVARADSGATVPWITYEAESMNISGGTILGPQYGPYVVMSESSGRKCVRLAATGQYVQFTNQSSANALVVRYSVPDTADGAGTNYTLSLYVNGALTAKLPLTSKYSWLYGSYSFTNYPPAGSPRNLYDEVRTNGLSINAGDLVRLQKDASDTALDYVIDLVDVENVAAPLSQPANSLSIISYGAVGDGVTDCTAALQNCINATVSQGKQAWIPAGEYLITGNINLPSNTTLQGAGMWYTKLIGSVALYNTPSRRINLNGNGSNIHLADFAILGFLNYRKDTEGNDGIGGRYGTGSSISRIWVEHTKAAAWIANSSGLLVDGCRFRNTLADGINLNSAMLNTVVTNCTARGTGDDCFAIWPASSGTYAAANNVITHCTGELTFLANGGAIYGGANNRIEDCLFKDMTYGCGILISTTFPVASPFSGTTVAQRNDVIRCGGFDPGYGWRAAVLLCMDQYNGISGVNLNHLNITNSISDGMGVIGAAGPLTNALASEISLPNYGLGASGRTGLWARDDAIGSLTVSNSTIVAYRDDSPSFTFNILASAINVTVQTSPPGRSFTVDGTNYTSAQTLAWTAGVNHTIATTTPQIPSAGTRYLWSGWSDGAAVSHVVHPNADTTYTASFATHYLLTMNSGAGGSASPGTLWTNSGAVVAIQAMPSNNFAFKNWKGSGDNSYSGSSNPVLVSMSGAITQSATFLPPAQQFTGLSVNPQTGITLSFGTAPGFPYYLETTTNLAPAFWSPLPGSNTNATGTSATFTDTNSPAAPQRFYRTVSP